MGGRTVCVRIDLRKLHASLTKLLGVEYLGARELSAILGISVRAAGRILAGMEGEGLAVRWSRSLYRLTTPGRIASDSVDES